MYEVIYEGRSYYHLSDNISYLTKDVDPANEEVIGELEKTGGITVFGISLNIYGEFGTDSFYYITAPSVWTKKR